MKTLNKVSVMAVSTVALALGMTDFAQAATAPNLGAADSYALFGKAGVTNNSPAGTTHVWGSVGADLLANITNLIASQVDGNIDTGAGVGAAALTAYGNLAAQAATGSLDLAGTNTVTPGVYSVAASTLNGTLTLDGAGVYIFQSSSSIQVTAGAKMLLINGASPCNVFWQIPTAMTIGAGTQMVGTIITNTGAITLGDSTTLQGRAFALTTQVTLINDQITEPTCAPAPAVTPPVAPAVIPPTTTPTTESADSDIKVEKEASKKTLRSGPEKVTFTYKVTNEGNAPLTDVSLEDNKCDDVDRVSGDKNDDDILDLTEEWKYDCTKTVKKTETNTATAKGTANGEEVEDTDKVTVTVSTPTLPNAGVSSDSKISALWNNLLALFS